jgi:DMSO/TMAO reductase YedYZ molybdopterin-dependent catalytic subunit
MLGSRLMVGLVAPVLAFGLLTFGWTLRSAAYHPVPEAHAYQGWSAGRPQVGTLGTPNDVQGAVALGAVVDSEPTPTPSSTPPPGTTGDSEWGLVIDGFVRSPLNLTFDDLVAMPASTVYAKLYCVGWTTTPIDEGNWTGVRLGLLLQEAGVSPEAIKVAFYADDGFTTDLTVTTAMRDDVILAYEKDGQPLTEKVRLVVPGKWGYKWIQQVTHIELVNYNFLGRYESAGLYDEADIPGYWGPPVGGIAELPDAEPEAVATEPGSSGLSPLVLAGVAAGGALLLVTGAWYARRRWGR